MRRHAVTWVLLLVAIPGLALAGRRTSVFQTKHNLSTSGRGDIKSTTETRVCIFCHSSHNASTEGPLWNHQTTVSGKFQSYTSASLVGRSEQPNGATKLCLSCHDGTIAVGAVRGLSRPIPMSSVGSGGEIPDGRKTHLGTDLTGTHPVSIKFEQNMALASKHLRWPPLDPEGIVGTDAKGYVQCTACHDPHGSRSEKYPFWNKDTFDQVCQVCHAY
jgi:predicted CXXCH cytochrome family protein